MFRVMIADDEPLMRKAMLTLTDWEGLGCQVVFLAENGQQVLDNLEHYHPDILVTDIRMPGRDGIELAHYIWENRLPIKVILLTAYADFSYAQSAMKYNVVDYVTKTGAFDDLVSALERAKELLKAEQTEVRKQGGSAEEYLLKSIFDGSIHPEEIKEKLHGVGVSLKPYLVLLLHFRLEEGLSAQRRNLIYHSLENFFSMALGEQLKKGMSVNEDMYVLLLEQPREESKETLYGQAEQIIDMMDNFMNLEVYIGVSSRHTEEKELRQAYQQAYKIFSSSFLGSQEKIVFYDDFIQHSEKYDPLLDQQIDEIGRLIALGDEAASAALFEKLLLTKVQGGYQANTIKYTGIVIQQRCRKLLAPYGTDIYGVTGITDSISDRINRCFYMDEFEKLMQEIIGKTAAFIKSSAVGKNILLQECEHYMEQHYQEGLTVTDIADHLGISISYLSRLYKEATGEKLIHKLNEKRMAKAKELLTGSDMKIYEIAEALGFENTTYFSYFFKKYTGISPKDYK